MSRQQKIITGIFVALILILAGLVVLFLLLKPPGSDVDVVDIVPTPSEQEQEREFLTDTPSYDVGGDGQEADAEQGQEPVQADEQSSLRRLAAAFAERFGSFSNTSDFVNLSDLKAFMSPDMSAWADTYIADARARGRDSTVYFGVTTRALSATVESFDSDAGTAVIRVATQRREDSGTSLESEVYYQDLMMDFVKIDDIWKADSAEWTERE